MAEIYIKMAELVKLVGHKRGMILRMMNKNDAAAYDPSFPQPVPIGRKAEAWRKSDIDRWLFAREIAAIEAKHDASLRADEIHRQKLQQQAANVAAWRAKKKLQVLDNEMRRDMQAVDMEREEAEFQQLKERVKVAKYKPLDLQYYMDESIYLARFRRIAVIKYGKKRRFHYAIRFLTLNLLYNIDFYNVNENKEMAELQCRNESAFGRMNDDFCKISIL
ncbi:MAG: AlpA family phage regulatory protein [Neisseria sp.]|nr:AlpA family phage regulatory protein [Neisseria sp.]